MKKSIVLIILLIHLVSCEKNETILQYGFVNSTDNNITVEYELSDNEKKVYTIAPSKFALIHSVSLTKEMKEIDTFNTLLSKIRVSADKDNLMYFVENDSISDLSKWGKNASYDMGDEYILFICDINSDMFKKN